MRGLIAAALVAANCLVAKNTDGVCALRFTNQVSVQPVASEYRTAPGGTSGYFRSAQPADIALSAFGFNQSGGALQFRYNSGMATDGTRLLVADRSNNRVLVWNSIPDSNTPPDVVLGQVNFDTTDSGSGLDQLNWPIAVATDGRRVVVADTNNDRLLVWNSFPTSNGTKADLEIRVQWPWGVWTDGTRLVATATMGGTAFVWRTFPTQNNQAADIRLRARGDFGTPRTITSNGQYLMIGDHNAKASRAGQGNFVWKTFPDAEDAPYDFFTADPLDENVAWLQGSFTPAGQLLTLGGALHLWNNAPGERSQPPDLSIRSFSFHGGDGSDVAVAAGRVFVSGANGNRILVYNSVPETDRPPDFALGSPDVCTSTLESNHLITNPVPSSNGKSLFVTSDFDRKLYVWKSLPDESGAKPDWVYSLNDAPWQNALHENTFVAAGKRSVYIWRELPNGANMPTVLRDRIGTASLVDIRGVAYDGRYFSIADLEASRVYIWEGLPTPNSAPQFTIEVQRPGRLSSDGTWLVVAPFEGTTVRAYRFDELSGEALPRNIGGVGRFNLPGHALIVGGQFFVADTSFHRVHYWTNFEDALAGRDANSILGSQDRRAGTSRERMFMPGAVSFDGSYLWIGEFKFSGRLLRHSPSPGPVPVAPPQQPVTAPPPR